MPANFKAELVGCFGQPVAENPTGVMQEAAFQALGFNWRYLTIEVGPAGLADAIRGVRAFGMRGINLTIPHKVAVMRHLDEIAPDAAVIGAVNTVRRDGDRLIGENTDGKGFLRGVRADAGLDPRGKRVVVLGAGGAARAIVTELALAGAADVLVVNRSAERGEPMVADLKAKTGARTVERCLPGSGAGGPACERDVDRPVPRRGRHAAGRFGGRAGAHAGVRRSVQSARDAAAGSGAAARPSGARRPLDAGVSGRDRVRVVDRNDAVRGGDEGSAQGGAGVLGHRYADR